MSEKKVTSVKRYVMWIVVVLIAMLLLGMFVNPSFGLEGALKYVVFAVEAIVVGFLTFTPIAEGGK